MTLKLTEINEKDKKSEICNNILRALPNWFGNELAIVDYVSQVKAMTRRELSIWL